MRWFTLCLVAAGLLSSVVVAPSLAADDAKLEAQFKKMDKDGDGKLSETEYLGKKNAENAEAKAKFKELDKDGDGSLTLEEFKASA